jgi:uncharacterized RDD family membrane protein YckC
MFSRRKYRAGIMVGGTNVIRLPPFSHSKSMDEVNFPCEYNVNA